MGGPDDAVGEAPRKLALEFTRALTRRDYDGARAMTTEEYRRAVPLDQLRAEFEEMIPLDWGETEPVEVITTMADWPDRRPDDVGWLYVSISGEMYGEAVVVIVTREADALRIRSVELGRP